ncbi:MAG TPA: peptide chain release factor 1 [Candidatus Bathyarchaeia archaeon]|nr:peptide chain release factor 1 [Candidatus Bathyarchaeia archaeon]
MNISWDTLKNRRAELIEKLANAGNLETKERVSLQKELSRVSGILELHAKVEQLEKLKASTEQDAAQATDSELAQLFKDELLDLEKQLIAAHQALENSLVPPDELGNRSVFLEIRAGTGGQEAALFAADLVKMYTNYALGKGWRVSVVDQSFTDLGGIREITLYIQGNGVYEHLKYEAGVHRVQRIPKTETGGRIHTSTATVAVLPEAEEVEVNINPSDLRIDVFRSSGAGGQHVNTTDSAVRITHLPSNVVVTCQDERSQHKNKAKALKMLQARLLAHEIERHETEQGQKRKEMVGRAMRAEKVRTYNFPQNRITDHQVELTLNKLDIIMTGELDEIIEALREKDRQERRARAVV